MINLELWKQRRKELNLNYEKLSEISGVSKRSIEDIFRGFTSNPRIDTVRAIEKALGIAGNEISAQAQDESLTDRERKLLTIFRGMPEYLQNVAFNTIEQLAISYAEQTTTT